MNDRSQSCQGPVRPLTAGESYLRQLFEESPQAMILVDRQWTVTDINFTGRAFVGLEKDAPVSMPCGDLFCCINAPTKGCGNSPACRECHVRNLINQTFETGQPVVNSRCRLIVRKGQATVPIELLISTSRISSKNQEMVLLCISSAEAIVQAQEERETTIHLLGLLNSSNDLHDLVRDVTGLMQAWSGCEAVGIRLRDGEDYPYFETRGFPPEFVQLETNLCARDPNGNILRDSTGSPVIDCMCGNVICGRFNPSLPFFTQAGSFWTNCTTELLATTSEKDRQARTRNRCNGEGYESVALVPLRSGNAPLGLLQFNDHRKGRFTPEKIQLFERLAASLSVGLAQRMLAKSLQESKAKLDLAIQASAMGVWRLDILANKRYFDRQTCALLGLDEASFNGTAEEFYSVVHEADREMLKKALTKAIEEDLPYEADYRVVWQDKSLHYLRVRGRVFRGDGGKAVSVTGVVWDVTQQRRLEDQYRHAQKMEAIGRLAAGVAHDFNNQLTVILGYSEMLLADRQQQDPAWEPLMQIRQAGIRAQSTTNHLLSFSRKQMLQPEPIDLGEMLTGLQHPVSRMIGEDIKLQVITLPGVPRIFVDKAGLQQAVMNLIVNARDAMPNGGQLTLRTATVEVNTSLAQRHQVMPGKYVQLEIRDTGTGIAPALLDKILDPFFTTKEVGKGTGLGLSMVQGFVQQSLGAMEIQTKLGEGTTVRLLFPAGPDAPPQSAPAKTRMVPAPIGKYTILVVEDEENVRSMVVQTLRTIGHEVIEASRPTDAIKLAFENTGKLDLMISDVVMPEMRGTELAEILRKQMKTLPVLLITGYSENVPLDKYEVLYKPFDLDQLVLRTETMLRDRKPRRNATK